jgi:hypothetical protein
MSTFNACQHIFCDMLTLYGVTSPHSMLASVQEPSEQPEFLRHQRIDCGTSRDLPSLPHEPCS